MLQVSIGKEGAVVGKVWMDPNRDVAHAFVPWVKRALDMLRTESETAKVYFAAGGSQEELNRVAVELARFVKLALGVDGVEPAKDLRDALEKSGVLAWPPRLHAQFGQCLSMVILGAYFKGSRECVAGGPIPGLADQLERLETAPVEEKTTFWGWLGAQLKRPRVQSHNKE